MFVLHVKCVFLWYYVAHVLYVQFLCIVSGCGIRAVCVFVCVSFVLCVAKWVDIVFAHLLV